MTEIDWNQLAPETGAIRAGQRRTAEGEHSDPIFATSSYVFDSAAEAALRFSGQSGGNIYSRFTNPTVRSFEERLATLECGQRCIAVASGMGAIATMALGLLKSGDHVVCSRGVFGNTVLLFQNIMGKFGVTTTFVDLTDITAWEQAIRPETRLLFVETPSNPLTEIADLARLAELAHHHHAWLAVDNCFCTPALQRPLEWGADLVIHSATKYLDGQGRCLGGAIVGASDLLDQHIYPILRTAGPTLSAFNAWVFLKGLETLSLRMKAHSENALQLARWLEARPTVKRVHYPGLPSHPQHELAMRQQSTGGGIVSFEVEGGREAAWQVIDSTRWLSITANLGDVKTTITHPASTTHSRLSAEERAKAGIGEGLIRIAVGLENIEDIKNDLKI
ncbi:MAG: O-succinylhomoserine sulfhydrylase [Methylococcaceae bacterium]